MYLSNLTPIDNVSLASLSPGLRERIRLFLVHDLGGMLVLHALAAVGRMPGRTLFVVAGVHGDEYEGMEAIRQVFATLDPSTMHGTFFGIPVANPLAYAARTRATPTETDGLNLARVFPGSDQGTVTQRLAHHLLDLVERNVGARDLFVDLHSGTAEVIFAPMVGFRDTPGIDQHASEEAARHFGLPRLWRIPNSSGPFNAETARRGIPTIGTETTGRAGCRSADVAMYCRGLNNLLAYLGIVTDAPAPERYSGVARPTIEILAPIGGFFRGALQLHDHIQVGKRLGEIIDVTGDTQAEVSAPTTGEIWAIRETPAVRPGELIGMIAH